MFTSICQDRRTNHDTNALSAFGARSSRDQVQHISWYQIVVSERAGDLVYLTGSNIKLADPFNTSNLFRPLTPTAPHPTSNQQSWPQSWLYGSWAICVYAALVSIYIYAGNLSIWCLRYLTRLLDYPCPTDYMSTRQSWIILQITTNNVWIKAKLSSNSVSGYWGISRTSQSDQTTKERHHIIIYPPASTTRINHLYHAPTK